MIVNQTVNVNKNVYINRNVQNAITVMPARAFVQGKAVQKNVVAVQSHQLNNTRVIDTPSLAPVKESFAGEARAAKAMPPKQIVNRQVMFSRQPKTPAAFNDTLAEKYSKENGTAPGAGPAIQFHLRKGENNSPAFRTNKNDTVDRGEKIKAENEGQQNAQHIENRKDNVVPRPPVRNQESINHKDFDMGKRNSPELTQDHHGAQQNRVMRRENEEKRNLRNFSSPNDKDDPRPGEKGDGHIRSKGQRSERLDDNKDSTLNVQEKNRQHRLNVDIHPQDAPSSREVLQPPKGQPNTGAPRQQVQSAGDDRERKDRDLRNNDRGGDNRERNERSRSDGHRHGGD